MSQRRPWHLLNRAFWWCLGESCSNWNWCFNVA